MTAPSKIVPAAAALLSLVLFAISANIVFASLLRVSDSFGVSAEAMATVSSVQFSGFFLSSLLGGLVADRIGKRRVLQGGCFFVMAGSALWSAAPTVGLAFAGGLIMGMGGGILEAMSSALLTDLYPRRRKLAVNLSQVAYCIGAVGGPVAMGYLLPLGVSWRWFFAATALAAGAVMLLYQLSHIPEPPPHSTGPGVVSRPGGSFSLLWALLLPCAVIFLYVFAEMGTATFMNMYLRQALSAPEQWAIYSLAIFWTMMVLGRLACAFLPETQGHEKVIAMLMGAAALAALCQLWTGDWRLSVAFFGLSGLAFAGTWPLIVSMVATHHASRSGTAVGVTVAAGSLGCIVAPAVFSPFFARGIPHLMFVAAAICLALGAILVLFHPLLVRTPAGQTEA